MGRNDELFGLIRQAREPEPPPAEVERTASRRGGGRNAELFSALAVAREQQIQAERDAPNNLERLIAAGLEKVPILQRVLTTLGRPLFAVANVAEAGVRFVTGQEGAGENLLSAARNIGQFGADLLSIPVTAATLGSVRSPDIARPEDLRTFKDVLTTAGVGDIFRVDLPLIGEVTGKGLLGLGFDIAADPFVHSRAGALTKAGKTAAAEGTLAKATVSEAGRVGSVLQAQAQAGQRALFQFAKHPIVSDIPLPERLGGSVLGAVEMARRGVANLPIIGTRFWRSAFPQTARNLDIARGVGGVSRLRRERAAREIWTSYAKAAQEIGFDEDQAAVLLLRAERGGTNLARRARKREKLAEIGKIEEEKAAAASAGLPTEGFDARVARLRQEAAEFWSRKFGTLRAPRNAQSPLMPSASDITKARDLAVTRIKRFEAQGFSTIEAARAARLMELIPGLDETLAPMIANYMRQFREIFTNERTAGVVMERLGDPFLHYITRTLTHDAMDFIRRKPDAFRRATERFDKWFQKNPNAKRRKAVYEGSTIPELNEIFEEALEGTGFSGKVFETDAVRIASKRARTEARSITGVDAIRRTFDDFGSDFSEAGVTAGQIPGRQVLESNFARPYTRAGGGDPWRLIEQRAKQNAGGGVWTKEHETAAIQQLLAEGEIVPTRLAGIENKMLPADVAKDLRRVLDNYYSPYKATGLLYAFDEATKAIKTYLTLPFLEFWSRNMGSGVYANFLDDVVNPKSYIDAIRAATSWRSGKELILDLGNGRKMSSLELLDHMEGHEARLGARIGEEMERTRPIAGIGRGIVEPGVSPQRRAGRAILAGPRAAARIGEKLGGFGEDVLRTSHVIDKMRKGMTAEDAIMSMKRVQFDYSALTPFEKSFMRRIVPFYSWSRFNLPLMIETLFTRPGKVSAVAHFQRWLQQDGEGSGPLDNLLVPEWTRRRLYGFSEQGDELKVLSGFGIGLEDLAIFDRPTDEFLSMLNPLLKAPLQATAERDFFRGTPLNRAESAPTWLRHFEAIPGGKVFLDWMDFRMVKDKEGNDRGYARANPRILNVLRGLPILSAATRFSTTFERFARDDRPTDPDALLKYTTGLRAQHLPKKAAMRQHMIGILETVKDRLEAMQLEGVVEEHRSHYVEHDMRKSPEGEEAKALLRLQRDTLKRLATIRALPDDGESEEVRRRSLRTGGR